MGPPDSGGSDVARSYVSKILSSKECDILTSKGLEGIVQNEFIGSFRYTIFSKIEHLEFGVNGLPSG